jgi:hypothetical protein
VDSRKHLTFYFCGFDIVRVAVILVVLSLAYNESCAQEEVQQGSKKGSYAFLPELAFEDNSFLLEEAFNQGMGVIQNISTLAFENIRSNNLIYSFTQEIPLTHKRHQLSYTLNYNILQMPDSSFDSRVSGFGDIFISYRPLIFDEDDWLMLIPRFTLILPTGRASEGLGAGGPGAQFNIAITKRVTRNIVTHYNFGSTVFFNYDHYQQEKGINILSAEKRLYFKNVGASIIWYPKPKVNLMVEYVSNFTTDINDGGSLSKSHQLTINPSLRFCIDRGKTQIVPGVGLPYNFTNGKYEGYGLFFYLSFEPDYLSQDRK